MKRFFRWIAVVLAVTLFTFGCTGCFSTAGSRQAKQGKTRMEAYLKTRGAKSYAVDSAYADSYRSAPDRLEMTQFVHGDYRIDGQKYEYWVNVDTGEIFTSERFAEFKAICYDLMLEELGVDRTRCVGLCNADFTNVSVSRVMPAEVGDPAAYARSRLHSDEMALSLWLVCSASEAPPNRWTQPDTADWNLDQARICVLPDGEPLPETAAGLGFDFFRSFEGDKYELSSEAVTYTSRIG